MKPMITWSCWILLATSLAAGCALEGVDEAGAPESHQQAEAAAESLTGPVRVSVFWGWFGPEAERPEAAWDGLIHATGASLRIVGQEQLEADDRAVLSEKNTLVEWQSRTHGDTDGVELLIDPQETASRVSLALKATGIAAQEIDLARLGCEPIVLNRDAKGHRLYVQRDCEEAPEGEPTLDVQVVWGSFAGDKPAPATWSAAVTVSEGATAKLVRSLQMESDDKVYEANARIAVKSTTAGDVDGIQVSLSARDWAAAPNTTICFNAAGTSACAPMKDLVCNQLYTAVSDTNGIFLKGNCPEEQEAAKYAPKPGTYEHAHGAGDAPTADKYPNPGK